MASPVEDQGARSLKAVTPSDTLNLPMAPCRALWVGVAGDVAVMADDDSAAVTLLAVPAGLLPVRAKRVLATGTNATSIVALY